MAFDPDNLLSYFVGIVGNSSMLSGYFYKD